MTTTTPSNLVKMPNYENDELIVTKTEVILFSGDKAVTKKNNRSSTKVRKPIYHKLLRCW